MGVSIEIRQVGVQGLGRECGKTAAGTLSVRGWGDGSVGKISVGPWNPHKIPVGDPPIIPAYRRQRQGLPRASRLTRLAEMGNHGISKRPHLNTEGRDGSVVKNICLFSQRTWEFESQAIHRPLLAATGTCTHTYIYRNKCIQIGPGLRSV